MNLFLWVLEISTDIAGQFKVTNEMYFYVCYGMIYNVISNNKLSMLHPPCIKCIIPSKYLF